MCADGRSDSEGGEAEGGGAGRGGREQGRSGAECGATGSHCLSVSLSLWVANSKVEHCKTLTVKGREGGRRWRRRRDWGKGGQLGKEESGQGEGN